MATLTYKPTGQGASYAWSTQPAKGNSSHYQNVDDPTIDNLSTYNYVAGESSQRELYTFSHSVPEGSTINHVTVTTYYASSGGSNCPRHHRCLRDSSGNVANGSDSAYYNSTTFTSEATQFDTNPAGGSWSYSDLTGLQFGMETPTSSTEFLKQLRVTMITITIDYTAGESTGALRVMTTAAAQNIAALHIATTAVPRATKRLGIATTVDLIQSATTFRPTTDDGATGSHWAVYPASPTSKYDKLDEATADEDTTYIYYADDADIGSAPSVDFTCVGQAGANVDIANGSSVAVTVRHRKNGALSSGGFKIYIEKSGTRYYASSQVFASSYADKTKLWATPPWGGEWGRPDSILFGVELSSFVQSGGTDYLRLTQIYLTVTPPYTDKLRVATSAVVKKTQSLRLATTAYQPTRASLGTFPWWDSSYARRREIQIDASHDATTNTFDATFTMTTGYEVTLNSDGVWDEGIQHSGKGVGIYGNLAFVGSMTRSLSYSGNYAVRMSVFNLDTRTVVFDDELGDAQTGDDTHFTPITHVDAAGYVHSLFGAHNSIFHYVRNTNGDGDYSAWDAPHTLPSQGSGTYPRWGETASGRIAFMYRRVSGDDMYWSFAYSDDHGDNWSTYYNFAIYRLTDTAIGNPSIYSIGSVIDGNGRTYFGIVWHDNYLEATQYSRAIDVYYTDDFEDFYDYSGVLVWSIGDAPIDYDSATHVIEPSSFPSGDTFGGNGEQITVDDDGNIFFTYYLQNDPPEDKLYFARYVGGSWYFTDMSALSGGENPLFSRNGGTVSYLASQDDIVVHGFVYPDTYGEQHGAELYRWVSHDKGASWSYDFVTRNTAFGIPMIATTTRQVPPYGIILAYCRGPHVSLLEDKALGTTQRNGDDIRIIRTYYNGVDTVHIELDRVPDRWQSVDSQVTFKMQLPLNADATYDHPWVRHFVYYANAVAVNPPADTGNIYPYFESWESYGSNVDVSTLSDWSGDSGKLFVFAYNDTAHLAKAHPNKVAGGQHFAFWGSAQYGAGSWALTKTLSGSNVIFTWSVFVENQGVGFYIEFYDDVTTHYIRVGVRGYLSGYRAFYQRDNDGSPVYGSIDYGEGSRISLSAEFKSSGCTAIVGTETLTTNNTRVSSFTHIRIGAEGTGQYSIDTLKMQARVDDPPLFTLGSEEGDTTIDELRIATTAAIAFLRSLRLSTDVEVEADGSLRAATTATPEYQAALRVALATILAKTSQLRIANIAKLLAIDESRVATDTTAEASDILRVMTETAAAKYDRHRLHTAAQLLASGIFRMATESAPEATSMSRYVITAIVGTTTELRYASIVNLLANGMMRIATTAATEAIDQHRIATSVAAQATQELRLASIARLIAAGQLRINTSASLEAMQVHRIMTEVAFGAVGHHRVATVTALLAQADLRLMTDTQAKAEATYRLATIAAIEMRDVLRVATATGFSVGEVLRIYTTATTQAVNELRMATDMTLLAQSSYAVMTDVSAAFKSALHIATATVTERSGSYRVATLVSFFGTIYAMLFGEVVATMLDCGMPGIVMPSSGEPSSVELLCGQETKTFIDCGRPVVVLLNPANPDQTYGGN